jgi:predicted transcriptional regulator
MRILSNPTRRKILQKLVQEYHYPLQLSRELRISQQAITKHLKIMEQLGVVECVTEKSETGPPRKMYIPTKNLVLTINLGPQLFETRMEHLSGESDHSQEYKELEEAYRKILHLQNYKERLKKLGNLLIEVDEEIREIEEKRLDIIRLKQRAIREAYLLIEELYQDYDLRAVLYALLNEDNLDLQALSDELDIRERALRKIIEELVSEDVLRKSLLEKKKKIKLPKEGR